MSRKIWILALLLPACSPSAEEGEKRFFDLEGFARSEQLRLSAAGPVRKSVLLDGSEEVRVLERPDWKAEMDLLAGADINRPAWRDSYRADTLHDASGQVTLLTYEAVDPKLRVRKLEIFLKEGVTDSVSAILQVSNPLHDTEERLHFGRSGTFDLERVSRRRFGKPQDLLVSLRPAAPSGPL